MSTRSIRLLALVALPVLAIWLGNQLERTRFGEWMELRSYDLRFRLRGPLPPPTHPGILRRTAERVNEVILYLSRSPEDAQGLRAAARELEGVREQLELTAIEIEKKEARREAWQLKSKCPNSG